jgi:hypothetical protein
VTVTADNPEGESISDLLSQLEVAGYTGQFVPTDGAVRCGRCGELVAPAALVIAEAARTEGESDPSEMAIVIAASCPQCEQQGTLTISYGPEVSDEDAAVLAALPDLDEKLRVPRHR